MHVGFTLRCFATAVSLLITSYAAAEEAVSVDVSYANSRQINDAFARFAKRRHNLSCFRARVVDQGGGARVEIYSSNNTKIDEERVTINTSSCGPGAVFTYDASGRFVRVIYTR